ncbi:MAG TPA: threonine ammonia-lyase [Candidatus Nitrosotenuis sp.]|jgi:threonine dehydratase|nr:threonine ammonia-lyase [Candidatus Nitrosotenuis sp.]
MKQTVTLKDIQRAGQHLKDVLLLTPTIEAPWLNVLVKGKVYLKLENLQVTNSFKPRGAYIKMLQLNDDERRRGVIAMSAGNHAQGVAYHAHKLAIPAVIVMPTNTPVAKVERTQVWGAKVVLAGTHLSESAAKAQELMEQHGYTLIHPYDDAAIIAGQGTIALEMLKSQPKIDTFIIPVGGGGLASGMATAIHGLDHTKEIYGVQSTACPAMIQALYPQRWFMPPEAGTTPIAEGIAVKNPGQITTRILRHHLTDILSVTDDQIESAMNTLLIEGRLVTEGAGAAGVAALLAHKDLFVGKTIGIVICGGNVDARIISSLVMRGLVHARKLVRLKIRIHDAPGMLARLAGIIGNLGGNIFEINHQRLFNRITVKMADIDAIVETRGHDHACEIVKHLTDGGFPTKVIE